MVIDSILQQVKSHSDDATATRLAEFAASFFSRVPIEDLAAHDAERWARITLDMYAFVRERAPATTKVRVFNPTLAEHGYESSHSVVQIATDDMPFLVDSVSMAITQKGLHTHALIHPVYRIERDGSGKLLALDADDNGAGKAESVMYLEVDRSVDLTELDGLREQIATAIDDVRAAVTDWQAMRAKMLEIATALPSTNMPGAADSAAEAQAFLRWANDDNFTFLGFREYEVANSDGDEVLRAVDDSGLGILRGSERSLAPRSLRSMVATALPHSGAISTIILTKTNALARVHRPGYMDYIGVLKFDAAGRPVAEQRFLGLFTSAAYMCRPQEVPLVRQKVEAISQRSGLRADSHSGKALRHILEMLPRDELFQGSEDELYDVAMSVLDLQERARTRVFIRRDRYGRFFSCLVYLPRDRFSTGVRERIESTLKAQLHGERIDTTIMVGESSLARLHLLIRPKPGDQPEYELDEVEASIIQIVRNWHDALREILVQKHGDDAGTQLAMRYGRLLPVGYIEEVTPMVAANDVELAAQVQNPEDIRLTLYASHRDPERLHFKVFRMGGDIALSEVIPLLENLGVKVLTEQLYTLDAPTGELYIQDITVRPSVRSDFAVEQVRQAFETAFERVLRDDAENDGFNKLILSAKMDWRQISVLRGYCKYLLQTGVPFSQNYMEETLVNYPAIAGLLIEYFEAKFDPAREDAAKVETAGSMLHTELMALISEDVRNDNPGLIDNVVAARGKPREQQAEAVLTAMRILLERVSSIDEDRILRSFMAVIRATLRTNFYQLEDGAFHPYIAFKFDPAQLPDLPKPRPYREVFVYGPRVEGTHLRFGPVARGGLRWSDRREDFRTEVLGLVKAQMVKNTIIVPVGSKGGFIVKRPPASADRDAVLAEGIACYKMFINGLLDITDNLVEGAVVHPQNVVRHDDDDPYMVVAADKGTARFSDIANAISAKHNYWLGDAFASGGSVGYDHKGMGITAKGAWESVKRHFRALGIDSQSQDFTCAGIGDMSGDVFGNGMRLSRHIRLVAAFDHRHVFIDPNPDAARSFEERERMFKVPGSSWADYDTSLISAGGGVYPRSAKSVTINAETRAVLGLADSVTQLTPTELVSAVLRAPVDLLWNGGIGTYIKSEAETNADVGDRANNALRINGSEVRARIIGEGGNLGMTQRGRIEAAMNGVLLNTDFIDNSAGVDTSDHEVNIKILLNDAVRREELTVEQRNTLLREMTDEVERLVLFDNYRQNDAISLMERMSVARLGSKQHFIRTLESQGLLDRQIEDLPTDAEFEERKARKLGLTRPELAILLSYSKIVIYQELLDSDVPEDAFLSRELRRYFPEPLRERFAEHMERHRLKREIIATAVTNSMVNRMGATFLMRMQEDTGKSPAAIAKAFNIAREVLDARGLWADIEALDGKVNGNAQIDAKLLIWEQLRNKTRWLLNHAVEVHDIAAAVANYHPGLLQLRSHLVGLIPQAEQPVFAAECSRWVEQGFPQALADQLASLPALAGALDIVMVAAANNLKVEEVAAVYFELGESLHLKWLMQKIEQLPVVTRWHAGARGAMRDELNEQQRALTAQVLAQTGGGSGVERVAAWNERDDAGLKQVRSMLDEMHNLSVIDYPIVSVAVRRLGQLVQL